MAKCFDVTGYIEPCNVVRKKYTGRALLITGIGEKILTPTFSVEGLGVLDLNDSGSSFASRNEPNLGFVKNWTKNGGEALPVIIDAQNPFGVTIQGNTDSGRVSYTKTIPISVPAMRDGIAEEFIMGLQKGLYNSAVIVLESFGLGVDENNKNNDIFGVYSPLRLDPTSVTRSEYENGGAWSFNLVCEEPVPNVICTMTGLDVAIDELNA